MSPLFDAHAHFFYPGFVEQLPTHCRRINPDEITLYQALAARHEIAQVLAVGYEGDERGVGNNAYLATLAALHKWVRPTAFVADPRQLTTGQLETWQRERFVGISLYIFTAEAAAALQELDGEIWQWLIDHSWLLSVNSTGDLWAGWHPVLERYPTLRVLIAHLGLPPAVEGTISSDTARTTLSPILALGVFPQTHVKFSGFYALAVPSHDYPHRAAWPYAEAIHAAFGRTRILWASDFSPALEHVSFPQTIDLLRGMSWLAADDLAAIYHDNLARLLNTVDERNPTR